LPVTFLVKNPGTLVPGAFVDTYLVIDDERVALTVPNTAIVEEMGAYFVFVEVHDDMYIKTPVALGGTDGFRTEILSGFIGGEIVVSKGAIFIKLAQGTGTIDAHAGHVH
jgi:multidrug efflux pump subunit AcrA (membrane-fusion protein)